MDLDDCTEEEKRKYKSGDLFNSHWAKKYIIPIFNEDDLEEVIKKCGIKYEKIKNKTQEYLELFPRGETTRTDLCDYEKKLRKCNQTNLEELFSYCLNYKKI